MVSITILSTVKNINSTVHQWIDSIISQEFDEDFDVVIIDSCSSDGTKEVLENYARRHHRMRVEEFESTQPAALNYALDNFISSDLTCLIDGDCIAPKNWLSTLYRTLKEKHVDAVGGPGFTPPNANIIQKLIGLDLDTRFLSIPQGPVKRHPNMNLLIKSDILKNLRFKEEFEVGYDTEFGYRLNSKGYKMFYEPKAFVWHYHRASIRGYSKQQFLTGKYAFLLYMNMLAGLGGDNINPLAMILQPLCFGLIMLSIALLLIDFKFIIVLVLLLIFLFLLFTSEIIKAFKINRKKSVLLLYILYAIRLPIWILGGLSGFILYLQIKLYEILS